MISQEYFDNAVLMVAMVKAGVELAFEAMVDVGMKPESAYYESLHETPLIANTIARKKVRGTNEPKIPTHHARHARHAHSTAYPQSASS